MPRGKTEFSGVAKHPGAGERGEPVRQRVIDAAERLLRDGKADFSMRDLAAEARVSFATPFNQFGNKAAIMHALSRRRIDTMAMRFAAAPRLPDAAGRVLLAIDTAVAVMLEEPGVNRAVLGWIGTASGSPGQVWEHSTALWISALGAGEGLAETCREQALRCLPRQLALAFRGALSFWTAGELPNEALGLNAREIASTLLLAFTGRQLSGGPVFSPTGQAGVPGQASTEWPPKMREIGKSKMK